MVLKFLCNVNNFDMRALIHLSSSDIILRPDWRPCGIARGLFHESWKMGNLDYCERTTGQPAKFGFTMNPKPAVILLPWRNKSSGTASLLEAG